MEKLPGTTMMQKLALSSCQIFPQGKPASWKEVRGEEESVAQLWSHVQRMTDKVEMERGSTPLEGCPGKGRSGRQEGGPSPRATLNTVFSTQMMCTSAKSPELGRER